MQLPEVERVVHWSELREMCVGAEAAGFDSVWVGDHLLYRGDDRPERGPLDAWSVLAALAASTERVELGPLVTCTGFRPPGLLARTAAAVDDISGGRLVLGLGCGWNRAEFEAFGYPYSRRVDRFAEAFDMVRRLLSGERVTTRGEFFELRDAVLHPAPLRRPPLMIGSNSPRMLSIALPHVERWNTWWDDFSNTAEGFAKLNESITAAAERAGRDPTEIHRSACLLVELDPATKERRVPDGVTPVRGGADAVAAALDEMAQAGADEVILVADPINLISIDELGEALAVLGND